MAIVQAQVRGKKIVLHKAVAGPLFGVPTVLTNTPWAFVGLWLKRHKKERALFYWEQAQQFQNAARDLPPQSAPLPLYYSFLNAAKALLSAKSIAFQEGHGVGAANMRTPTSRRRLSNEGVQIKTNGVLPTLNSYLGYTDTARRYNLKDLLLNLPYVHRTYCLTYRSQKELFVPLKECKYVFDTNTGDVFAQGLLTDPAMRRYVTSVLPPTLVTFQDNEGVGVRSVQRVHWNSQKRQSTPEVQALSNLRSAVRFDLQYISGAQALWYVRLTPRGAAIIGRRSPVITLAAMHRLSEVSRYHPSLMTSFIDGDENWLLSEFISMSSNQYLDEIASEITGHQFLVPNIRAP